MKFKTLSSLINQLVTDVDGVSAVKGIALLPNNVFPFGVKRSYTKGILFMV